MDFKTWLASRNNINEYSTTAPLVSMKVDELRRNTQKVVECIDDMIVALNSIKRAKVPYFHLADEAESILKNLSNSELIAIYMNSEANKDPKRYVQAVSEIINIAKEVQESQDKNKAEKLEELASNLDSKLTAYVDNHRGSNNTDDLELAGTVRSLAEEAGIIASGSAGDKLGTIINDLEAYVKAAEDFA